MTAKAKMKFTDVLNALAGGDFVAHCTEGCEEVVAAVAAGNGKGKISIEIEFARDKRMIVAKAEMKLKVPRSGVDKTMFYVDDKNQLSDEDPAQVTMNLKSVPRKDGRVVELHSHETKNDPKKDN